MDALTRFLQVNASTIPADPSYWGNFLKENGPYVTGTILLGLLVAVIFIGNFREWWVTGPVYRRAQEHIQADLEIRKLREKDTLDEIVEAFNTVKAEFSRREEASQKREEASQKREEALQQRVDQLTEVVRSMNSKLEGIGYAIRDERGGRRNDTG